MPVFNYYSIRTWKVSSQEDNYIIDFPFLRKEHIVVYLDEVNLAPTDIEWTSDSQFKILAPVLVNQDVVVRRFTKQDKRLVDYHDGSTLVEQDLNIVTKQLLYLIQELSDYRTAGIDPGNIPGQNGDPNDPNGDPEWINAIIDQILATQTFQNLIELIELTDINAETIIQNSLTNHNDWSVQRLLDKVIDDHTITLDTFDIHLDTIDAQIINIDSTITTNQNATALALDGVAVRFDDAEANILTLQTAFADSETATATLTQQLQAEIDDNNALILTVDAARVTADAAMTGRVDLMESTFTDDIADANARIGTVEQTYVSNSQAAALIQTEIDLWYGGHDWEALIGSSSYINGVEATVTAQGSDIQGITSYLVGSTGTFETPEGSSPMASLANLQTTVDGHTDSISSEIDFRNAMFAYFNPNTNDGTGLAAAMEQRWKVYADSESSLVERTESLEVNQQPIFFRASAPNPLDAEFSSTRFSNGFPAGSLWHDTGVPTRLITYFWHDSNTPPYTQIENGDFITFTGITGMWVRKRDLDIYTQGASIQTLQEAYSELGIVGGTLEDNIQAVVGADIAAISETMEAWFNTETGQMYSGWQVRINQYNGGTGTPVIAGIGLGMENDPENPEADSVSDFMVMADRFSIIRPPTALELESGLASEDVFVPFIVNTNGIEGEPEVIVNASMFVKNTLSAMDGLAGRFTFTELNSIGLPVTEDASRLVLASDTNDYNTAVGQAGSPWSGGSVPQKYWIWAGSGDMNHTNAKFYIDTDGNAVFRGEVLADNVTGDISNIHEVDETGSTVTATGTGWNQVRLSEVYQPSGSRERTPSVIVNVDMFGSGQTAGKARIEGRAKDDQGEWGAWQVIAEAPIYMPIGTTLTLAGTMAKTSGDVQLRSLIQRHEESTGDWQYPSSSYMKGVLQMLA